MQTRTVTTNAFTDISFNEMSSNTLAQLPSDRYGPFGIPSQKQLPVDTLFTSAVNNDNYTPTLPVYPKDQYPTYPFKTRGDYDYVVNSTLTSDENRYARYLSPPNRYDTPYSGTDMFRDVDVKRDRVIACIGKHSLLPSIPVREVQTDRSFVKFGNDLGYVDKLNGERYKPNTFYAPAHTVPPNRVAVNECVKRNVNARASTLSMNAPIREQFSDDSPAKNVMDETYINSLKVRANMLCEHLRTDPKFEPWSDNWVFLKHNLERGRDFKQLKVDDGDIAYVMDKGTQKNFRIRAGDGYVPYNVYQYVLYHEMSHMSTHELQHTPGFYKLLDILCAAAYEIGLIDLRRYKSDYHKTAGQPILTKSSITEEIIRGFEHIRDANASNAGIVEYCESQIKAVKRIANT